MTGTQRTIQTRVCQDCPETIPANGGRKRCLECQDKERVRQLKDRKQRARKASGQRD